jgi:hypothetical protein
MHIDCESHDGILAISYFIKDPTYKYSCPWCRLGVTRPVTKVKEKRDRKNLLSSRRNELELDYRPALAKEQLQVPFRVEPVQVRTTRFDEMLKRYGST